MNQQEAMKALEALEASPASAWIGSRLVGGVLTQVCTRCGLEATLELPKAAILSFQRGERGDAFARDLPEGFDESLFVWKRDFQIAHEDCLPGVA